MYANPKSKSNSNPISLTQTPFSSSPIPSFRFQPTNKSMQQEEQQQYNNVVVIETNQSSRLSTPHLLDYFHQAQSEQQDYQEHQEQQEQQNENGDNEINLVIDIPDDAVAVNMNNNSNTDQNNDDQPSPTNSQFGNM